jgi:hypothetical protein
MKDLKGTMNGGRITARRTTEAVITDRRHPMETTVPSLMEIVPVALVPTIIVTEATGDITTTTAEVEAMDSNTAKEEVMETTDPLTGIVRRTATRTITTVRRMGTTARRTGMTATTTSVRITALASKGMTNGRPKRIPLPRREKSYRETD